MQIEKTLDSLQNRGFRARYFAAKEDAASYLIETVKGTSVGFGGCMTAQEMGLYEALGRENEVHWHWKEKNRTAAQAAAAQAKVYILSANALAETGELVNIDGNGNRLAAMFYGHERVIFVVGINKLTPDLPGAIDRARNVASPLNARRLKRKTPCALTEPMRCHDCRSPERICGGMAILMEAMRSIPVTEVLLIGETLGY